MLKFGNLQVIGIAVMLFSALTCFAHDILSVKDAPYNATGDGVTDDTAAFNAAIYALATIKANGTVGGYLYVPTGVYRINNVLVSGCITLCGDNQRGTILKANGSGQVLRVLNPYVTIQDMVIDGMEGTYTNNGITNSGGNAQVMVVKNVQFKNISGYAVSLDTANQVEISNCTFHGGASGMLYSNASPDLVVKGCIFEAKTVPFAIKVTASTNAHSATIMNNWFEFDVTRQVTDTIVVDAFNTSIINNKFLIPSGCTQHETNITVMDGANRTMIVGNNFQNCGSYAKNIIIEEGALSTFAYGNYGATGSYLDSGTSTFLVEAQTSTDSTMLVQKKLLLYKPEGIGASITLDADNTKIYVGSNYFGYYGADAELGAYANLHLKPSSTGSVFSKAVDTKILKPDGGSGNYASGRLVLSGKYLWVDSAGKLRIKSSAPTSDTDGTIVGQQ